MNSIIFYVDMYDNVVKCEYIESIDEFIRETIILPPHELHNILFRYVKNNPKVSPVDDNGINVFAFHDVDIDEMDRLMEKSKNYQHSLNQQSTAKKVNRKNKFKKVVIKTTAATLATLTVFAVSKKYIQNIDYVEDPSSISFNDDVLFDFNPQIETLDMSEKEESVLTIDDTKDSNVPEEVTKTNQIEQSTINCVENKNETTPDNCLRISADNLVNSEKYNIAKAYYSESLSEIAKRYGIDPALALAVGIHERGIHSDVVDRGGAVGLFQIQVEGGWNWDNRTITAYNFDINEYEEVLITKDSVSDVFKNMQVGCMLLQNLLVTYDYNVATAVTAYNYGSENVRLVLERCSRETGFTMEELKNINNIEWLKYRDIIGGGDPEYLENVFKYIPDETILTFTKPNGEIITVQYDNLNYENNKNLQTN